MSSRGRRNEREVPVPLPPRRLRHRGFLLVSLIVLIWNLASTGYMAVEEEDSTGTISGPAVDASGKPPIRVRQKYLLGHRVDINRASRRELSDLPGISDAVAEALLAERRRTGGFRRPGDLLRVRGIREKRLKKILPFLTGFHNN